MAKAKKKSKKKGSGKRRPRGKSGRPLAGAALTAWRKARRGGKRPGSKRRASKGTTKRRASGSTGRAPRNVGKRLAALEGDMGSMKRFRDAQHGFNRAVVSGFDRVGQLFSGTGVARPPQLPSPNT
jgi:hypothetical protein